MGGIGSYSAITTKVKAMQSKLLTREEFFELAAQKSIADVVVYLKRHAGYQDLFSQVNEQDMHREDVERILTAAYYENFSRLFRFAGMEQKKYLKLYFKRFEITLLKSKLRNIFGNRPFNLNHINIRKYFDSFSKLNTEAILSAVTITDFVSALTQTPYHRYLNSILSNENAGLFDYESALDLYYFTSVWREKKKRFQNADLKMFERSFGFKIDLLNLQWIYRSKKYYDLSSADILALMIPVQYKLKNDIATELVNAANIEDYNTILKKTYYAKIYPDFRGEDLEDIYILLMDKIHASNVRMEPYSLAVLDTYLYRQEYEINKLITIQEGIRYGLKPDEIIRHMKMKQGGEGQ